MMMLCCLISTGGETRLQHGSLVADRPIGHVGIAGPSARLGVTSDDESAVAFVSGGGVLANMHT